MSDDLAAARTGDAAAWGRLAAAQAPMLAAYLGARIQRPAIVERLLVQTLISAWRHLADADPADLGGWLRRQAATQAKSWAKEHPLEALAEPFPRELCSDLGQHRRMDRLQRALGGLDEADVRALEAQARCAGDPAAIAALLRVAPERIGEYVERALDALDRSDASLAAHHTAQVPQPGGL